MRNEESIGHIVRDYRGITNLLLTYEIFTLYKIYQGKQKNTRTQFYLYTTYSRK